MVLTMSSNSSSYFTMRNDSQLNQTLLSNMGSPLLSPEAFRLLTNVFFSCIIATGVIGNGLVIATILRWKEMRSPCNLFLLNISIADLCLTGIGGSFRIVEVYFGWIFGDFLCRFLAPMQDVFVSVSGITHSTIAWERYRATVTPFKPRISKGRTKRLLPVIWVVSYVACGLPLVFTTKQSQKGGKMRCSPHWSILYRRIYEVYLVAVFIVLQLVLQTYAYANIIRALRSGNGIFRRSTREGSKVVEQLELTEDALNIESRMSFSARNARCKQKAKTIKTLIVLVVVFQVCYIPRGTVMLVGEFATNLSSHFRYVELISLILYYLKHVLNPVILFLMSAEFSQGLKSLVTGRINDKRRSRASQRQTCQVPPQASSGGKKSVEEDITNEYLIKVKRTEQTDEQS
ncbi:galanin receptor type 2-like [Actinia tenebrosa]|uniref:Galanin receptor type 2-like n=1 Tax=Actinia tenebrosa TaxID=6105 RepID=A0A6P8GYN2_ACTTE|nr:galanin receptor type 2-like [Actinia tenebrosa]